MHQNVDFALNFSQVDTVTPSSLMIHHEVQAFDVLRLEIPARAEGMTVELVPPHSVIHFLGIFKTVGVGSMNELQYSVGTDTRRFVLEHTSPHFISSPLIAMLQPAPERLTFHSNADGTIEVLILVGRDAVTNITPTPPTPPTK